MTTTTERCTCGHVDAKPKHHEASCPVWKQYIKELDDAYRAAVDATMREKQRLKAIRFSIS